MSVVAATALSSGTIGALGLPTSGCMICVHKTFLPVPSSDLRMPSHIATQVLPLLQPTNVERTDVRLPLE